MDDRIIWVNITKQEYIVPVIGSMYSHPMHLAHDGCHSSHLALYAMLMLDNGALPTDILRPFDPNSMRGAHMSDTAAIMDRTADRYITQYEPGRPDDGVPIVEIHGRWAGDRIVFLRHNDKFDAEVGDRIRAGETHWLIPPRHPDSELSRQPLTFTLLQRDEYFLNVSGPALQFLADLDFTLVSPNAQAFEQAIVRTLGVQLGPHIFQTRKSDSGKLDLRFMTIHNVEVVASHVVRDVLGLQ